MTNEKKKQVALNEIDEKKCVLSKRLIRIAFFYTMKKKLSTHFLD